MRVTVLSMGWPWVGVGARVRVCGARQALPQAPRRKGILALRAAAGRSARRVPEVRERRLAQGAPPRAPSRATALQCAAAMEEAGLVRDVASVVVFDVRGLGPTRPASRLALR